MEMDAYRETEKFLLRKALEGDADIQNALGVLYIQIALKMNDIKFLQDAEKYLSIAAKNGCTDAREMLEVSWPLLKQEYTKIILGRNS